MSVPWVDVPLYSATYRVDIDDVHRLEHLLGVAGALAQQKVAQRDFRAAAGQVVNDEVLHGGAGVVLQQ